jgi:hypothetical protein
MRRIVLSLAAGLAVCHISASADDGRSSRACDLAAALPGDRSLPMDIAGVPLDKVDAKLAIPACQAAVMAAPENPRLLFQMGRAFGSSKNYDKARGFFEKAAGLGHAPAQTSLGVLYANGLGGLPKDDREAARLFALAARQGDASAQSNLAFFYSQGRGGLPKDEREAVRLYKLAAAQGFAVAQANLGAAYSAGLGGLAKDDEEAARLYKLAAAQGNAIARALLAGLPDPLAPVSEALKTQISRCWKVPAVLADVKGVDAIVRVKLNQDGTLATEPTLLNSSNSEQFQAAAENALAAIRQCQPFKLPMAQYDRWKNVQLVFDPHFSRPLTLFVSSDGARRP